MTETILTSTRTRNDYIDVCRGIAAISIVAIHTAFYGYVGVPEWFRSLTLLIDVPFFFYLSGWASSYRQPDVIRAGRSILKIWAQWLVFVAVINIFCYISQILPFSYDPIREPADLIRFIFFDDQVIPGFSVISLSIWFFPIYFLVLLINNAAMTLFVRSTRSAGYMRAYLVILILAVLWACFHPGLFGYYPPFVMFYCAFWMIGYMRADRLASLSRVIVAIMLCAAGFVLFTYIDNRVLGISITDLHASKVTPSAKYMFASLIAIVIFGNAEKLVHKPNRVLAHVGRNAIYYFCGQGVGSSIIYLNPLPFSLGMWFADWLISFVINVLITAAVAESMRLIYIGVSRATTFILSKIRL